jgi:hypothetical protein
MTENELIIQTKSNKRTDFQTDRVLLLGQVTDKEKKAHPSHFLKILLADPHCTHLVPAPPSNPSIAATKRVQFLPTHHLVQVSELTVTFKT